jgi:hypothetical protein
MSVDLKKTHAEISRRLDRLDFGRLLPGFHRFPFALYDKENACFGDASVPADERFIGNTAIKYEGKLAAIWGLRSDPADLDTLAASVAHEMCHCLQIEAARKFPEDIDGAFYPRDIGNFAMKHRENLLLAELCGGFSAAAWREFVRLRSGRLKKFPGPVAYELSVEAIEGEAEYVEQKALSALSPEKAAGKLAKRRALLSSQDEIFDARRNCYSSGAALLLAADSGGTALPDWRSEAASAAPADCDMPAGLERAHEKYFSAVDALIAGVLSKASPVDPGGSRLFSFDPYNVRSSGNDLYHPHFIMCADEGKEPRCHMGTFITRMKGRGREIASVYKMAA